MESFLHKFNKYYLNQLALIRFIVRNILIIKLTNRIYQKLFFLRL